MKVTITTTSLSASDYIYDLLTTPTSGEGCLSGEKICIHEHGAVPDIMEFDLTQEEIKQVRKLPDVKYVFKDSQDLTYFPYEKIDTRGIPALAVFNSSNTYSAGNPVSASVSHSMYYCQNRNPIYTHQSPVSGETVSLSSIDCSNIDILVIDSGVDPEHSEFRNTDGSSRVIKFDWTQLRYADSPVFGTKIMPTLPANWYNDTTGHGTSCASLAAGNKCGFAKKARIYNINIDQTEVTTGLNLALSFHVSKNLGLYGLQPGRPTIATNSWGYVQSNYVNTNQNDVSTTNFNASIGSGATDRTHSLTTYNTATDGYIRSMLSNGVHVCVAAGNSNHALLNTPPPSGTYYIFDLGFFGYQLVIKTPFNKGYFVNYLSYNEGGMYTGYEDDFVYGYKSPGIGMNENKQTYPLITVGCVTPLGKLAAGAIPFSSGGAPNASFKVLSATTDERIIRNNGTRYDTLSGPLFVKSVYSNFGPGVDIYAPGNGTWAAKTTAFVPGYSTPTVQTIANDNNSYLQFFNGTSSACPIVAGILATYLTENIYATPLQAKQWLLSNAISGNIMETRASYATVSSYDANNNLVQFPVHIGYYPLSAQSQSVYRLSNNNFSGGTHKLYNKANIDDVLLCSRFFDSNNLIAQAHPLRTAVLSISSNTNITLNGTTMSLSGKGDIAEVTTHKY